MLKNGIRVGCFACMSEVGIKEQLNVIKMQDFI